MNFNFNEQLAYGYKKATQKVRVMSESWVADNMFCPCCGQPHIHKLDNNKPVADFQCIGCGEIFELKSKKGSIGKKINDGAYSTMIERITSTDNPDLFILKYTKELEVTDLYVIPKFFFVPSIIEKRKPLSSTSKRAGWVGCNILVSEIPSQGRIDIISHGVLSDINDVVNSYSKVRQLQTNNLESRGWLLDVLNCVNKIPNSEFSLQDVYKYTGVLQAKHTGNHNVEAKIRQQLQILRDKGFIEFLDRGHYRKKR